MIEHVYGISMSILDDPIHQRIDARIAEIADVAGALNLANAQLVRVMERVLTDDDWSGPGIHSPAQWLTYRAGITVTRAKTIITVAERRADFPCVMARFDAGELSLEQVAELVRAPAWADAHMDEWGLIATPARIRTSIKLRFGPDDHDDGDADQPAPTGDDPDRLSTGVTDDHRWRINGNLDLARGHTIDAALIAAREALWAGGQHTITLADCLVEVCETYLDGITEPTRRERSKTWLHLDAVSGRSVTSTGIRMPDSVRDRICCDGLIQPVWEQDGAPVSVGRTQRIVPERTRRVILLRDGGCKVPGCTSDRFLEIHHIIHWLDGGPTDTWNLVALCPRHHRFHHNSRLGITGNADQTDGLTFTDERGRLLASHGSPAPPGQLPTPTNGYTPPLMDPIQWDWIGLNWKPPDTDN